MGVFCFLLFLAGFSGIVWYAKKESNQLIQQLNLGVEELLLASQLTSAIQNGVQQALLYSETTVPFYLIDAQEKLTLAQKDIQHWRTKFNSTDSETTKALTSSELETEQDETEVLNEIDKFLTHSLTQIDKEIQHPTHPNNLNNLNNLFVVWERWLKTYFEPNFQKISNSERLRIERLSEQLKHNQTKWMSIYIICFIVIGIGILSFLLFIAVRTIRAIDAIENIAGRYALGYFDSELNYAPGEYLKLANALKGMAMSVKRSTVDRETLTGIMDSQPDMLLVFDKHTQLEFANKSALKALSAEITPIGIPLNKLFNLKHDYTVDTLTELLETVNKRWVLHNTLFGEIIEIVISTWKDRHEIKGFVFVIRDISEQEAMREHNARIESEILAADMKVNIAEAAAQMRQSFMANMSHELRTPLHGILGLAELLEASNLLKEQRVYIQQLRASGRHMLSLINDVLDVAKLEAGKITFEELPVDLYDLVEDVLDICAPMAFKKHLLIISDIDCEQDWLVLGDEKRLRQILLNLVSNAIKFTLKGHVIVFLYEYDGRIILKVLDTGIGIASDKQQLIFNPFNQADSSTTREFGGTGLGLTVVKQLVEAMSGELELESTPNVGSMFSISLPLLKATRPPNTYATQLLPPPSTKHILIAVSQTELYQELENLLLFWGQHVSYTDSIDTAVKLLKASYTPFDICFFGCCITDKEPEFDAIKRLRQAGGAELRLILITPPGRLSLGNTDGLLYLPLKRKQLIEAIWPTKSPTLLFEEEDKNTEPPKWDSHHHILLAEDNSLNQEVALTILSHLGFKVTVANNGEEALEYYLNGKFSLILMDGQMPKLDGYQATKKIRQLEAEHPQHKPIVIIALTAHALAEDRQYCLDAGMDDFLSKPFSIQQLADTIQRWIPPKTHTQTMTSKTNTQSTLQNVTPAPLPTHELLVSVGYDASKIQQIRSLQQKEKPSIVVKFVTNFLETTPIAFNEIVQATKEVDAKKIKFVAHKLKSGCSTLGLTVLAQRYQELEKFDDTPNNWPKMLEPKLAEIHQAYEHATQILANEIEKESISN